MKLDDLYFQHELDGMNDEQIKLLQDVVNRVNDKLKKDQISIKNELKSHEGWVLKGDDRRSSFIGANSPDFVHYPKVQK